MKLSVTVGVNSRADKSLVIKLFKENQDVDLVEMSFCIRQRTFYKRKMRIQ